MKGQEYSGIRIPFLRYVVGLLVGMLFLAFLPTQLEAQRFVLEPGKSFSQDNNQWETRLLLKHNRPFRLDYSANLTGTGARLIIGRASNEYSHRSVPVSEISVSGNASEINPQNINLNPGRYYARITNSDKNRTSEIIEDTRQDLVYSNEILLIIESPNAATIIGPRGITENGTPTFDWEAVSGVEAYWIIFSSTPFEIVTDENDDISVQGANLVWQFITDETTALYGDRNPNIAYQSEAPPLNPGQEYSYAILNLYEEDNPAFASAVFGGVIPMTYVNPDAIPKPELISPVDNSDFQAAESIAFTWTEVEEADSYTINLYEVVTQQGVDATIPIWSNTTTNTLIDYPALANLKNSEYLWNVVANDIFGGGTTSGTSTSPNNSFTYRIPNGEFRATATDLVDGSDLTGIEINIRAISGGVTPNSPFLLQGSSLTDDLVVGRYEFTATKSGYADNVIIADVEEGRTRRVQFDMDPLPAFVSGRVVDETGEPVDRATVRLRNLDTGEQVETITGSNGRFGQYVDSGEFILSVRKAGYISPSRRSFLIDPDEQLEIADDLRLRNDRAEISGYILNDAGTPVQLANVSIEKNDTKMEVRSNASGFYSFVVSSGDWVLRAGRSGFVPSDPEFISISAGDNLQNENLILVGRANQVSGFVREVIHNEDGSTGLAPFRDVQVVATPSSGSVVRSTTSSNGQFSLNLRSGTYRIQAVADNYTSGDPVEVVLGYGETLSGIDFELTPNPSMVRGRATLSDGSGLENVRVVIPGLGESITGSTGRYSISVSPGSHRVRASRSGYVASDPVDVSLSAGQTLDGIDFVLSPHAAVISGRVESDGSELANASVKAESALGDVVNTNTDEFGRYSISLAPGAWGVQSAQSGFLISETREVTLSAGQERQNLNFNLTPNTQIVRGTVSSNGEPLRNVTVRVTSEEDPDFSETTLTQVNGGFGFSLTAGVRYQIRATRTGYRSASESTPELQAGADPVSRNLQLSPSPSSVAGVARDDSNNPLEEATIRALNSEGQVMEEGVAGRDGSYNIGVESGTITMEISRPGYEKAVSEITVGLGQNLQNVNFRLNENFAFYGGRVVNGEGEPVEDALVNLTVTSGPGRGASFNTSPTGTFSFNRLIGSTYDVVIRKSGYTTIRKDAVVFEDGQQVSEDIVLLAEVGEILGAVIDFEGNPVPDASVTGRTLDGQTIRGTTGPDGRYDFSGVSLGSYRVTAVKTGYSTSTPIEFELTPEQSRMDAADISELTPNLGQISGVITDPVTDAPVNRVDVTVSGATGAGYGVTNNQGEFQIDNLGLGTYEIVASRDGYRSFRDSVDLSPEEREKSIAGTVSLNDGRIDGIVTNQHGDPLSVAVDLSAISANERYTTRTQTDGSFRFDGVETGVNYRIETSVYGEGLNDAGLSIDYPEGVASYELTEPLRVRVDNSTIRGNVTEEGVSVRLIRTHTGEVMNVRSSEPDGSFRFRNLREGNWTLVPQLSGFDFTPDTLVVSNLGFNETREVNFQAQSNRGTVIVTAERSDGNPVSGAQVRVVSTEGNIVRSQNTGEDGKAEIVTRGNITYVVMVTAEGLAAEPFQREISLSPEQTINTSFVLREKNSVISGRITRSDNEANMGGVDVTATNQHTGQTQTVKTESNGTYRLDFLGAGVYTVSADFSGFQRQQVKDVEVAFNEEATDINLALVPSVLRYLQGYVTYRGEGVPDVPVTVRGRSEFTVSTNANGRYRINNFPIRSGVGDTTLVEVSIDTEFYQSSNLFEISSELIGGTFTASEFILPSGQIIVTVTDGVHPIPGLRVQFGRLGSSNLSEQRTSPQGLIASAAELRSSIYSLSVDTYDFITPSRDIRIELDSDTSTVVTVLRLPYRFSPVDSVEAGNATSFRVNVTDGYQPDEMSGTLYYRRESRSSFSTVAFLPGNNGLEAEMPAQLSLENIVYYIEIEDSESDIVYRTSEYEVEPLAINILSSIRLRPNLVGQRLRAGDTYQVELRIRDGENNSMIANFDAAEGGTGTLELELIDEANLLQADLTGRVLTVATAENREGEATVRVRATYEGQVYVESLNLRSVDRDIDKITISRPAPRLSNEDAGTFSYAAFDTSGNRILLGNSIEWSVIPEGAGTIDQNGNFQPRDDVISEFRVSLNDDISNITAESEAVSLFKRLRADRGYQLSDGGDMRLDIPAGAIPGAAEVSLRITTPEKPKKFVVGRGTDLSLTASDRIYRIRYSGESMGPGAELIIPEEESLILFEGKRHIGRFDQENLQWELFDTEQLGSSYRIKDFSRLGQFSLLAENEPLDILRVGILPNPFSPVVAPVRIGYLLTTDAPPAMVTIRIYNLRGQLVRTLLEDDPQLPGRHGSRASPTEIVWDGLTDNGKMANNGRYIMRFHVRDGRNELSKLEQIVLVK